MRTWLLRKSNVAFLVVCAVFIGIKLLFQFYTGDFPGKDQALAFTWPLVAGMMALGLAGLYAERSLRLPDATDDSEKWRRAIFWSIPTGLFYGCVTVVSAIYSAGEKSPLAKSDWIHLALPWSIPFYTFGAIFLELLLRLGALCGLVWLVHVAILRRRFFLPAFWTVNLIVALYEVLPWMMQDAHRGHWGEVAKGFVSPLYLSNVFEGWLLLRFGWLPPILFRLAFYFVWHILYGGLARPT